MNKCPFCGSEDVHNITKSRTSETRWEDGLGSPGRITIREYWKQCGKCRASWQPPEREAKESG